MPMNVFVIALPGSLLSPPLPVVGAVSVAVVSASLGGKQMDASCIRLASDEFSATRRMGTDSRDGWE